LVRRADFYGKPTQRIQRNRRGGTPGSSGESAHASRFGGTKRSKCHNFLEASAFRGIAQLSLIDSRKAVSLDLKY